MTNVSLVSFNRMTEERLNEIIDYPRAALYREKLKKICYKLKDMAIANNLPIPDSFRYFAENEESKEITTGLIFKKTEIEKTAEWSIALHFEQDLNEAEFREWALIVRGIRFALLPNIEL